MVTKQHNETVANNQNVRRSAKSRRAWLAEQKEKSRMRRLTREKETLLQGIDFGKQMLRHSPLSASDRRQTQEELEQFRYDLRMVNVDIDYYNAY